MCSSDLTPIVEHERGIGEDLLLPTPHVHYYVDFCCFCLWSNIDREGHVIGKGETVVKVFHLAVRNNPSAVDKFADVAFLFHFQYVLSETNISASGQTD